jgi:hypothetical protein
MPHRLIRLENALADIGWLMTSPAFALLMRSFQTIPGQSVVKIFLTLRPVHQIVFPSVMLSVAGGTGLAHNLCGRMIAFFFANSPGNSLVTSQTLLIGDFGAQLMAFRAVGDAFQSLMRARELAGGNLRCRRQACASQNEADQGRPKDYCCAGANHMANGSKPRRTCA